MPVQGAGRDYAARRPAPWTGSHQGLLEYSRSDLLHHGVLRADGLPLAVYLGKHIHPNVFAAGIFSFGCALFGVATLYHGDVPEHLYFHGPKLEGLDL
jgi:hypothetical protein